MKRLFAFILITLMPAVVLANNVPTSLQGIWAAPSCNSATDTLVLYNGFYIWIGDIEDVGTETMLTGLELSGDQPEDFTRLEESGGYPAYFQILPDGRLREAFMPDDADGKTAPDADWETEDYERCEQLASDKAMLHGEAIALLDMVNAAQTACQGDQALCAKSIFVGLDVSGDNNLSIAELSRLFRVAGYLAAVSEDTGATDDDLSAVLAASLPVAPLVSAALVNSFDYDNSGTLSLAEISQDRTAAIGGLEPDASAELGPHMDRIKQALKPLGRLLENFGQ